MLLDPNRCFTSPPQVQRPCRQLFSRALLSPAKPSLSQCLRCLGQQNVEFCNGRRLGTLIWSTLAIFEAFGSSNRSLLVSSGIMSPRTVMFSHVWAADPAKTVCLIMQGSIRRPCNRKARGNTREQTNITIKTCMYKIFQKVRCTLWCSLSTERSQPRRSGRSPLGLPNVF